MRSVKHLTLDKYSTFYYYNFMTASNASATLDQFIIQAKRDVGFIVSISETVKSAAKFWLWAVSLPVLIPLLGLYAQAIPFIMGSHIRSIYPALPFIEDRKSLELLKDIFTVYYQTLKTYRSYCLFRPFTDKVLDEIDEHLDSLNFVLQNEDFLKKAVDTIENAR